jgi:hypothetical protein
MPWDLLLALLFPFLLGLGIGLAYSWLIAPVRVIDSEPIALRADFKDQYRSVIAASFAGTGNLARAQARLSLLGDPDPIEALNAQAQRMLAGGDPASAGIVAALASALESGEVVPVPSLIPTSTESVISINDPITPTITIQPVQSDTPSAATETPQPILPTAVIESTPRPTRTAIPTAGAPFALTSQETICDANLPDGLIQVVVFDENRRQMPGMEIRITWSGGEDRFFTGLKPELGNGYADFVMTPDVVYSLQLGAGSDVATGIAAPACPTEDGGTYFGGFKLTFQEPD